MGVVVADLGIKPYLFEVEMTCLFVLLECLPCVLATPRQ